MIPAIPAFLAGVGAILLTSAVFNAFTTSPDRKSERQTFLDFARDVLKDFRAHTLAEPAKADARQAAKDIDSLAPKVGAGWISSEDRAAVKRLLGFIPKAIAASTVYDAKALVGKLPGTLSDVLTRVANEMKPAAASAPKTSPRTKSRPKATAGNKSKARKKAA